MDRLGPSDPVELRSNNQHDRRRQKELQQGVRRVHLGEHAKESSSGRLVRPRSKTIAIVCARWRCADGRRDPLPLVRSRPACSRSWLLLLSARWVDVAHHPYPGPGSSEIHSGRFHSRLFDESLRSGPRTTHRSSLRLRITSTVLWSTDDLIPDRRALTCFASRETASESKSIATVCSSMSTVTSATPPSWPTAPSMVDLQ